LRIIAEFIRKSIRAFGNPLSFSLNNYLPNSAKVQKLCSCFIFLFTGLKSKIKKTIYTLVFLMRKDNLFSLSGKRLTPTIHLSSELAH